MEQCRYDEKGYCSVHKRGFNPQNPGCAHWFDVMTLWCCSRFNAEFILLEVSEEVIRDFCHQ